MRFILVVAVMLAAPVAASARDYDCGDFSTQAEAQRVCEDAGPGDPIGSIAIMTGSPAKPCPDGSTTARPGRGRDRALLGRAGLPEPASRLGPFG